MHPGIEQMAAFYACPLGQHTAHVLRHSLLDLWPAVRGCRVMAYGYPLPYMRALTRGAECAFVCLPAAMGPCRWPLPSEEASGINSTCLADPARLPLPANSLDRVLLIHGLEHLGDPSATLSECSRILAPGGRLIVVVPHRPGLWAMSDRTPFGYGAPFARGQLTALLRDSGFETAQVARALHFPPLLGRRKVAAFRSIEGLGARMWGGLSGVLLVEAEKRVGGSVIADKKKVLAPSGLKPAYPGLAS